MKLTLSVGLFASSLLCLPAAQTPLPSEAVLRLDPRLDAIVAPDARVEVLKDDYFGFTEGPVWVRDRNEGYLLFSDMPANAIYKWTPGAGFSMFLEKAGFTGADASQVGAQANNGRLAVLFVGSNGLTVDSQGRLLLVAMGDRAIVRLEENGVRTTLAERFDGKRINGGNDIVVKSNGSIYFTDGTGGLRGRDQSPAKELPYNGVFLIKNGHLTLLDKNPQGGTPNGLALSPNEQQLYVNSANRYIVRYDVHADDTISAGRVFAEIVGDAPGMDGMKVDAAGNLYQTGRGGVWIFAPDGTHLGTIRLPPPGATNLAFGDGDGKGLYITNRSGVLRVRLRATGLVPGPRGQ